MFIIGVVLFCCLPLFIDKADLPSKPSILPQIYTSNPLTPFMQRFRAFAKNLVNPLEEKSGTAQKQAATKKAAANGKKSLLARAANRIKEAWEKSDPAHKSDLAAQKDYSALAENTPLEDEGGFTGALASVNGNLLASQRAPQVAAKGMHDITTKAAYEQYLRSPNYKPQDDEIVLPNSSKSLAGANVAKQTNRMSDRFNLRQAAGRSGYAAGSSSGIIGDNGSTKSNRERVAEVEQKWKDIHKTIDEIAAARADAKYPNPKNARERQAREQLLNEEKGKIIHQMNDAYVKDLSSIFNQNIAEDAQPNEIRYDYTDDIADMIHKDIRNYYKGKWIMRSINNDGSDNQDGPKNNFESNDNQLPKMIVIGSVVDAEKLFKADGIPDWQLEQIRFLYENMCNNKACVYNAKTPKFFENNDSDNTDLLTSVAKANFSLDTILSEEERTKLQNEYEQLLEEEDKKRFEEAVEFSNAQYQKDLQAWQEKREQYIEENLANEMEEILKEYHVRIEKKPDLLYIYDRFVLPNVSEAELRSLAEKEARNKLRLFYPIAEPVQNEEEEGNEEENKLFREWQAYSAVHGAMFDFTPQDSKFLTNAKEKSQKVYFADSAVGLRALEAEKDVDFPIAEVAIFNMPAAPIGSTGGDNTPTKLPKYTDATSVEAFSHEIVRALEAGVESAENVIGKEILPEQIKGKFAPLNNTQNGGNTATNAVGKAPAKKAPAAQ